MMTDIPRTMTELRPNHIAKTFCMPPSSMTERNCAPNMIPGAIRPTISRRPTEKFFKVIMLSSKALPKKKRA
jgi:hypothetical protein